jgi:hypothetical protein
MYTTMSDYYDGYIFFLKMWLVFLIRKYVYQEKSLHLNV